MKRKLVNRIFYSFYLFVITFFLLEIVLRIYNPFHFSIKGNKIFLESKIKRKIINDSIPGIEREITSTRNSIGLRGPEPPQRLDDKLSFVTIGGSTTECKYISDGKTWSDLLYKKLQVEFDSVWLNNAGLSGHSTYGHAVLLHDYIVKLKPKVALFLIGCNDMALNGISKWDRAYFKDEFNGLHNFLIKKSEVFNVAINLWRSRKAWENKLSDRYLNLHELKNDSIIYSKQYCDSVLNTISKYLPSFKASVNKLIDTCVRHNILPVLITQPALCGIGRDSLSGANLAFIPINDGVNGFLYWRMLEMYNEITRTIAKERNIPLVDLAHTLTKGGHNFYDNLHFNLQGNENVANIIFNELSPVISKQFPDFIK